MPMRQSLFYVESKSVVRFKIKLYLLILSILRAFNYHVFSAVSAVNTEGLAVVVIDEARNGGSQVVVREQVSDRAITSDRTDLTTTTTMTGFLTLIFSASLCTCAGISTLGICAVINAVNIPTDRGSNNASNRVFSTFSSSVSVYYAFCYL